VPLLVTIAFAVIALGNADEIDFRIAQICFVSSCIVLGIQIILLATKRQGWMPYLLTFACCGALGLIGLAAVNYVNRKREAKVKTAQSPQLNSSPNLSPTPLPSGPASSAPIPTVSTAEPSPPTQEQSKREGAQIRGTIDELYFDSEFTPAVGGMNTLVVMKVRIANDGVPTIIQGFKLTLLIFDRPYLSELVPCTDFHVERSAGREKETSERLSDIRDSSDKPLERHLPRDGWLCFQVRLPAMNLDDQYIHYEIRLRLEVVDGAAVTHTILGQPPFNRYGSLKRAN
jgi:hypothetical protein